VYSVDTPYYTLASVAAALRLSREVLLTILDELFVKANKNQKYGSLCPDEFNLGLSIIDKKRGLLVPKYCRCQMQHENSSKPASIFDYLELSDSGVAMLREYIKQLPEIVEAVDHEWKKFKSFK